MYVNESLATDRHRERLRQAHDERLARQVAELSKMERRRLRAEHQLVQAWRRVDRLRSTLGVAG